MTGRDRLKINQLTFIAVKWNCEAFCCVSGHSVAQTDELHHCWAFA